MTKIEVLRAMDYLGHIVEAIDRIHRYVEVAALPKARRCLHVVVREGQRSARGYGDGY